jgi:hypothetical protein
VLAEDLAAVRANLDNSMKEIRKGLEGHDTVDERLDWAHLMQGCEIEVGLGPNHR